MGKKEYVKMSGKGPLAPPPAAASSGKPMKGKKQETTRSKGKEKDVGGGANPEQRNGKSKQKVEHQATKSLSKPGKGNLKRKGGETGGRRRGVDDSDEDGDSEDAESHIYVSKSGGKLGPSTGDDFDGEDPSSPFSNCPHLPELSLSLLLSLSLVADEEIDEDEAFNSGDEDRYGDLDGILRRSSGKPGKGKAAPSKGKKAKHANVDEDEDDEEKEDEEDEEDEDDEDEDGDDEDGMMDISDLIGGQASTSIFTHSRGKAISQSCY